MTAITREDAEQAWPAMEATLTDKFNVSVVTRLVSNEPRTNGWWGAEVQPGEWTIVFGTDVRGDDPKAAQLPTSTEAGVPVRYYHCPSLFPL